MLLNAAKCQGYSFYCFCVIKGKSTGEGNYASPPPRLGLTIHMSIMKYIIMSEKNCKSRIQTSNNRPNNRLFN